MQITIFRGTHEIGGNCIEVRSGQRRIILDVGMPLVDDRGHPFDAKVLKGKSVRQLLQDKILPSVPGLFRDPSDRSPWPDAILLSHSHTDHVGLVPYTRPDIPVFLSEGTSKMLLAASMFTQQQEVDRHRGRIIEKDKRLPIDGFNIRAYNVDHSAYDSLAFVIEADGRRLLYSGDLRLHGRKPGMAKRLMRIAEGRIDVAIMEGTHAEPSQEERLTEQDLEGRIVRQIKDSPGIVLAHFSPMHVDRLVTFLRAAKRTGRTMVIDPYTAFVMHLIHHQCGIHNPHKSPLLRIYYNGGFLRSYQRKNQERVFKMFLRRRIDMPEILASPEKFLMVFRPAMVEQDFGGRLPQGCCCLYSYWAGYLEKPGWADFEEQVAAVGGRFITAHTSGHIFAEDTAEFLKEIRPKVVIPIHTFKPDAFRRLAVRVYEPKDGEVCNVERLSIRE